MKKAKLILLENKKDEQVLEDIKLGPLGRFNKMFYLIDLSLMFSKNQRLDTTEKPNAHTLKRLK